MEVLHVDNKIELKAFLGTSEIISSIRERFWMSRGAPKNRAQSSGHGVGMVETTNNFTLSRKKISPTVSLLKC